jgi:hypothetical protein
MKLGLKSTYVYWNFPLLQIVALKTENFNSSNFKVRQTYLPKIVFIVALKKVGEWGIL